MSRIRMTACCGMPVLCCTLAALAACGGEGPADPDTGAVEVTAISSGDDVDGDGYLLQLDGTGSQGIGANATGTLAEVPAGDHEVSLTGVQVNCTVQGEHPRTVAVAAGETVEVQFDVACRDAVLGQIAFGSDRDGNSEIYVMNPDGSNQVRLTANEEHDRYPSVSPDGTRILFRSNQGAGDAEIYVMNADGSGQTNLTNDPATDEDPSWSPDGTRIAFSSVRSGDFEIYGMNADGSEVVNLTNSLGSSEYFATWSPDGTRIAFTSDRAGDNDIYTMNADGSEQTPVAEGPAIEYGPAWSPDGSRLAFVTNRTGNFEIFVMSADGSDPVNLSNTPAATEDSPSWSRNGGRIAFTSDATGDNEVWLINADGTGAVNVSNSAGSDVPGAQTWGP